MTSVDVEALRRRRREPMSAVEWRVSARYDGAVPIRQRYARTHSTVQRHQSPERPILRLSEIRFRVSLKTTTDGQFVFTSGVAEPCQKSLKEITFFHQFHRLTSLIIHHPSLFHFRLKTFLLCKSFPSSSGLTPRISWTAYRYF